MKLSQALSHLLLASIALPLIGCFSGGVTPKYTVLDPMTPIASPILPKVRLSDHLRAFAEPLCFHADGTVTPCRKLTYYVPLELAIAQALNDITAPQTTPDGSPLPGRVAMLRVEAFGIDARTAEPKAIVTLTTPAPTGAFPLVVTATRPLPPSPDPEHLRKALGEALVEAYTALLQRLPPSP